MDWRGRCGKLSGGGNSYTGSLSARPYLTKASSPTQQYEFEWSIPTSPNSEDSWTSAASHAFSCPCRFCPEKWRKLGVNREDYWAPAPHTRRHSTLLLAPCSDAWCALVQDRVPALPILLLSVVVTGPARKQVLMKSSLSVRALAFLELAIFRVRSPSPTIIFGAPGFRYRVQVEKTASEANTD